MSDYDLVTLDAQGNVHPVGVGHSIVGCGTVCDGVDFNYGFGGVVISFRTLTVWWLRALWFRFKHQIYWIKTLVRGPYWKQNGI